MEENRELIDKYLRDLLAFSENGAERLFDAMRYAVFSGGKRVRPLLSFAVSELLGVEKEDILPFAAGIEMIHTYSLIHDDLPAMDNDDFRRGKPTVHKKYDEATAILAGDALLTHAFFVLSNGLAGNFPSERVLRVVGYVALNAGVEGMVAGQQIDIEGEKRRLNQNEVEKMALFKTGKLIEASVAGPAILAGRSEEEIDMWKKVGSRTGLLFQIVDDILDETGDEKKVGKKLHKDRERGKNTFVTILGLENAVIFKNAILEELLSIIPSGSNLEKLVKFIGEREF